MIQSNLIFLIIGFPTKYTHGRRNARVKKVDVLIVQRNVLATAISALNSKRRNVSTGDSLLAKHGYIGNQALNDINVLLQMFQKTNRQFDLKSLNNVSDIVHELQEEMGLPSNAAAPDNDIKSRKKNCRSLEADNVRMMKHLFWI